MMNLLLDDTGLPGDPNAEEGLNTTMPERDSDDEGDYATAPWWKLTIFCSPTIFCQKKSYLCEV